MIPPTAAQRFDIILNRCIPSMTLVDKCADAEIYYCEPPWAVPPLWIVRGADSILVAYSRREDPDQINNQASSWLQALASGRLSTGPLRPVYGAWLDPANAEIRDVCNCFGDWSGIFFTPLPKQWDLLPRGWPETRRLAIRQLNRVR